MTTTTARRTAPITIGYTAIKCEHLAPETSEVRCTARCDLHIEGENGASVDIRKGEAFYLVRAESLGLHMFYIVQCALVGHKRCSCMSTKPCKHEIRIAAIEAQRQGKAGHGQAKTAPVVAKPVGNAVERTSLNGSRAFSVLRR